MHYLIHSNTIFRRLQVATVIQLVSGEARVQSPSQTPQAHVFFFSALGLGCGTWDLVPRPGIEPVPPAEEGGSSTSGPPGKSPQPTFLTMMPSSHCGMVEEQAHGPLSLTELSVAFKQRGQRSSGHIW